MATVTVTLLPEVTSELSLPRTVYFPNRMGAPLGSPGDRESQARALAKCLEAASTPERGTMLVAA